MHEVHKELVLKDPNWLKTNRK